MSLNRTSSWILVGLAAVVAVVFAAQPKSPAPADKADAGKPVTELLAELAAKSDAGPGGGPLRPVWDSYPFAESGEGPVGDPKCWPRAVLWKKYDASIRFLIATVPDPAESGFGYLFDQVVEAVQRALETQDYVIDRAWLPWPRAGARAPKGRPHEQQPGLILFRLEPSTSPKGGALKDGRRCARRFLALLLVGETATAGIHTAAFKASLKLIADCPPQAREEEPSGFPIRVLGPYFSGSQASLAAALKHARPDWDCAPLLATEPLANPCGLSRGVASLALALRTAAQAPPIHVVCGSATSLDHTEFVKVWKRKGDFFRSTIIPDFLIRRWVYKFLDNPAKPTEGTQPDVLVVLQEANTGFGRVSASLFRDARRQDLEKLGQEQAEPGRVRRILTIPFPLHISQLRTSYTKAQLAQLESLGLPRPAWNVPVPPGEEGGKTADPVPPQSPLITTALNSLVVNNLMHTMAQKRSRHIALLATDARDAVFLAELIRNRFPDVQLCTTGGNLLYTDPDHRYALWGLVVGSTYPLHPDVQGWGDAGGGHERRRLLFAEQSSQGSYNATLIHLGEQAQAAMLDYGWVGSGRRERRPGIWISAVGQSGQMVPLYYVTPEEIERDLWQLEQWDHYHRYLHERQLHPEDPNAPETRRGTAPPILWALLFVALTVAVCCFGSYGCYWLNSSRWGATFADELAASKQRIDFTVAALAVIVLYSWIARLSVIPCLYPDGRSDRWAWWANVLVTFAAVGMIGAALWCVLWAFWRRDDPQYLTEARWSKYRRLLTDCTPLHGRLGDWLPRASAWLVVVELAVLGASVWLSLRALGYLKDLLVAVLAFPFGAFEEPAPQTLIDFERLAYPGNGLSPLVPVFFLSVAFFAWGLFLVKKLHFANRHAVPSPFPANGSPGFRQLNQSHEELLHELLPPSTWQYHPGLCLLVFFLLVSVYVKLGHESIPPIDGRLFGYWTLAAFFAGSFLLIFTLCQVYLAWSKLRELLRHIARMPMVGAFARLPEKVTTEDGHLFSLRPKDERLSGLGHLFEALRRQFAAFRKRLRLAVVPPLGSWPVPLDQAARDLEAEFPNDPEALPGPFTEGPITPGAGMAADEEQQANAAKDAVSEAARKCLVVLHSLWPFHSVDEAFGGTPQGKKPGARALFLGLPEGDPVREWVRAAEDFVAAWVVRYLSQFFAQLRNLLTSLTVGSLLLLLAGVSYPFRPQSLLLVVLTTLCGAVAIFIVVLLVQVNRNELISRIRRSTPNRFTPDLSFLQGATAYVLPIVGGLMVQFPFFASGLRGLFEPLLHVIR
jgi:hypothetical protein